MFGLAFLLPNHYYPWATFWLDLAAAVGLALLFWSCPPSPMTMRRVPCTAIALLIVALVPVLQWRLGHVFYFGDAFIASFYLAGFAVAIAQPSAQPDAKVLVEPVLGAVVLAAIASVGLGLGQWLGIDGLGIFLMDFPSTGRPYANLAQPNQLATLLLLGIVAVLAMFQYRALGLMSSGLAIAWLLIGLAMTQSRTAWVAMALLVTWMLGVHGRAHLRVSRLSAVAMGACLTVLVVAWPQLSGALLVTSGRTLAEQAEAGVRLELWTLLIDAVSREPWFGYGWNQTSVAQIRTAADYAATASWIENSHNLVIELLIMNGVPLGGLLAIGLIFWLWRRAVSCSDGGVALAIGAVLVMGAHAMLEFPLNYAYFLLPMGIVVGFIEAASPGVRTVQVRGLVALVLGLGMTALLARVAIEYADIESRNRAFRFEMAGFGPPTDLGDATLIYLLTQLEELPRFGRTLATRDMSPAAVDSMRKMAERYAYPPVLFRYALASGLNGDPVTAGRMLKVLCHVHPAERCVEGLDAWRQMAAGPYPELKAVTVPAAPLTRSAGAGAGASAGVRTR
jgi:hypothetical protein